MKTYDYLIVGAGIFGATCARLLAEKGNTCLVIDARNTIGGNCADHDEDGITVHDFGAHIFHTNNHIIWKFVNRYDSFIQYVHNVKANYGNKITSLPFNMNTFYDLFGVITPDEAKEAIRKDINSIDINSAKGLELQAMLKVGPTIFNALIKEYTEKQWAKDCSKLDSTLLDRLPLRFTWDNNYFNDVYQGLPRHGYTHMITNMLSHKNIDLQLNCEYKYCDCQPLKKTIYCGSIDEFFEYKFGILDYRSLKFVTCKLPINNLQGCPVMNYTKHDVSYTRIIEHKHFKRQMSDVSIITYEYPQWWQPGLERYYPLNDDKNLKMYLKYITYAKSTRPDIIFGGRLGMYKYFDMDDAIAAAMKIANMEMKNELGS